MMWRWFAVVALLAWPVSAGAQHQPPWQEQFDGQSLHGWEIEGAGTIEKGTIMLGGPAPATLRLKTPLGDRFTLKFELRYEGPSTPAVRWESNNPLPHQWHLLGQTGQWMEGTLTLVQGSWLSSNSGSYSYRTLQSEFGSSSGSGGIFAGSGPIRDLVLVVHPGTIVYLRRIALQTTPPSRPGVGPWLPIGILGGLLLGVMLLGWLLNRRRLTAPVPSASK